MRERKYWGLPVIDGILYLAMVDGVAQLMSFVNNYPMEDPSNRPLDLKMWKEGDSILHIPAVIDLSKLFGYQACRGNLEGFVKASEVNGAPPVGKLANACIRDLRDRADLPHWYQGIPSQLSAYDPTEII